MRVAKTEEVIETGSQPAEQDPRHKRLGRRMHATDKYTHTHTHRDTCADLRSKKRGGLTDKTCAWGMCWKRHPQSFVDSFLAWSDGRSGAGCRQLGPEQEVCWG